MGKAKRNKNNSEERKVVKKTIIKTSHECSQCKSKCQKGIDYLKNMVPGRAYSGIACIK